MTHLCPGPGCETEVDSSMLMCPGYWHLVPKRSAPPYGSRGAAALALAPRRTARLSPRDTAVSAASFPPPIPLSTRPAALPSKAGRRPGRLPDPPRRPTDEHSNISGGGDDFRAAGGLASWSPDALDLAPETAPAPRGPGLFEVIGANGQRMVTNVRRLARAERTPGSALILAATVLLGLLAAGLFVVSLAAQYQYVFMVQHQSVPRPSRRSAWTPAWPIFSLLALGLAMAGQPAGSKRALIVVCAVASAGQNYAAADVTSPRA